MTLNAQDKREALARVKQDINRVQHGLQALHGDLLVAYDTAREMSEELDQHIFRMLKDLRNQLGSDNNELNALDTRARLATALISLFRHSIQLARPGAAHVSKLILAVRTEMEKVRALIGCISPDDVEKNLFLNGLKTGFRVVHVAVKTLKKRFAEAFKVDQRCGLVFVETGRPDLIALELQEIGELRNCTVQLVNNILQYIVDPIVDGAQIQVSLDAAQLVIKANKNISSSLCEVINGIEVTSVITTLFNNLGRYFARSRFLELFVKQLSEALLNPLKDRWVAKVWETSKPDASIRAELTKRLQNLESTLKEFNFVPQEYQLIVNWTPNSEFPGFEQNCIYLLTRLDVVFDKPRQNLIYNVDALSHELQNKNDILQKCILEQITKTRYKISNQAQSAERMLAELAQMSRRSDITPAELALTQHAFQCALIRFGAAVSSVVDDLISDEQDHPFTQSAPNVQYLVDFNDCRFLALVSRLHSIAVFPQPIPNKVAHLANNLAEISKKHLKQYVDILADVVMPRSEQVINMYLKTGEDTYMSGIQILMDNIEIIRDVLGTEDVARVLMLLQSSIHINLFHAIMQAGVKLAGNEPALIIALDKLTRALDKIFGHKQVSDSALQWSNDCLRELRAVLTLNKKALEHRYQQLDCNIRKMFTVHDFDHICRRRFDTAN